MPTNKKLLVVILISIILRVASAIVLGNTVTELPGVSDQISYDTLATRVIEGHGFTFDKTWWPLTYPGQPTAHWSYLYTLALGLIYTLFGHSPLIFRIIQAVLVGILTPLFTYQISNAFLKNSPDGVSERLGWVPLLAAAWSAVYGYSVYYAGTLMTEPLYITSILWVMWSAIKLAPVRAAAGSEERLARPASQTWKWAGLGISIGVTILLRQVFLFIIPFILLWLFWVRWKSEKSGFRQTTVSLIKGYSIVAAILAIVVLPFTFFNYLRFNQIVLLNTNSGFAFFWANHPIYGEQFVPILTGQSYQDLIPAELQGLNEAQLDSALLGRGIGFVLDDPARYIKLSLSRIPVYFMFWPSDQSGWLSNIVRVASFGLLFPLSILGILFWLHNMFRLHYVNDTGALLFVFIVVYSSIHLLSWSLIRYRLPVDALLLVFASMSVGILVERFVGMRAKAPVLAANR